MLEVRSCTALPLVLLYISSRAIACANASNKVVWNTTGFNNKAEWPTDGTQPFYLSTGDNTGYGQHGDYVFGWKGDALQRAMDDNGCFSATCGNQKSQDIASATKCQIKKTVKEEVDGCESNFPYRSRCSKFRS